MFNNIFIFKCLLLVILNAIQGQECFDFELAESDFPFDHLADFTADEDIGQNWGMEKQFLVRASSVLQRQGEGKIFFMSNVHLMRLIKK